MYSSNYDNLSINILSLNLWTSNLQNLKITLEMSKISQRKIFLLN